MSEREPKKAMMKAPSIQDAVVKQKMMKNHRAAALDVRNTIRGGKYLIAIFPIDPDDTLAPEWGLHYVDLPMELMPEIVALFKERMQAKLAARRNAKDDGKGPLEILDEVVAENTPAEEVDDVKPVDPAE